MGIITYTECDNCKINDKKYLQNWTKVWLDPNNQYSKITQKTHYFCSITCLRNFLEKNKSTFKREDGR